MADKFTIEHKGETIEYRIGLDSWVWNNHTYENATKARAAIDRANGKTDKGEKFTPREAYFANSLNLRITKVTVTGIGDRMNEFWIKDTDGKRSKVRAISLFAATPENEALFAEIEQLEQDWIRARCDATRYRPAGASLVSAMRRPYGFRREGY